MPAHRTSKEEKFFKPFGFGFELRKMRQWRGIAQEQIANETGLSRKHISLVENGKASPTVDGFYKICRVFDLKPWQVLYYMQDLKWPRERRR